MSIYSGARSFVFSLLTLLFFYSCNHPPETSISKKFTDKGEIEYSFSGEDIDVGDYISRIDVFLNGSDEVNSFNSGDLHSLPIISGENKAKATAFDKYNVPDATPAEASFSSPDKKTGASKIENILTEKGLSFEKNFRMSLGDLDIIVDYLISKNGKNFVVYYIGHGEKIEDRLKDKEALDSYSIPNVYLAKFPEEEIDTRVKKFIDENLK